MAPTLLLADDSPDIPHLAASLSAQLTAQILIARTGEEAFMRFQSAAPAAVFVATDLPGIAGSVLCQRIKHSQSPQTPVVLMSAQYQDPSLGERACRMFGADAYLAKPLALEAVRGLAEQYLPQESRGPSPSGAESRGPMRLDGSLGDVPVPTLLVQLYHRTDSGILTIERNKMRRVLYVLSGALVSATSNLRNESPGVMLVRDGILSEDAYARCLREVEAGQTTLTEAWVAHSALTPEALYARLSRYAREVTIATFAWSEGHYIFTPGEAFRDRIALFEMNPLDVIREAVRIHYPLRKFMNRVVAVKDKYLVPTLRLRKDLTYLHLSADEIRLIRHITGANRTASVLTQAGRDLPSAYQLLWVLLETGLVDTTDEPHTPVSPELAVGAMAPAGEGATLPPPPAAMSADIIREYFRVKGADYFQVLHLSPEADSAEIEKAYLEMESRYHPDAFSGFAMEEQHDKLLEILDKIKLAYRVLNDETSRTAYRRHLAMRTGGAPQDASLQAEMLFKKGEDALTHGSTEDAAQFFQEAISRNPAEADYHAYLGWAVFKQERDDRTQRIKTAKGHLNKALAMNPRSDKALLLLGRLFLEERKVDLAEEYFRRALDVNPQCTPAKAVLEGIERVKARKREKDANAPEGDLL